VSTPVSSVPGRSGLISAAGIGRDIGICVRIWGSYVDTVAGRWVILGDGHWMVLILTVQDRTARLGHLRVFGQIRRH
jgi:hypothetical protein